MSKEKTRWDVYAWVGCGDIKLRESNLTLKDAQKARDKWVKKSPKHEAFIATCADRHIVKGLIKEAKPKKAKSKSKAKVTTKGASKGKKK